MKDLPLFKLSLMIALAAWMHVLAASAYANAVIADSMGAETAAVGKALGIPETSSVVLIGALGLMLMLRRRRLQA